MGWGLFGRILTLALLVAGMAALLGGLFSTTAVSAQASSGISAPESGAVVAGVVEVQGTAVHPDYLRYELAFYREANPGAGWIVFAEGSNQVVSGTLAVWDTTVGREVGSPVFPDGIYRLRLRVVRTDYNYDEYFVLNVLVSNSDPTPTPTITATVTAVPGLAATAAATSAFAQPTPLPSLTPFPTPTVPLAADSEVTNNAITPTPANGGLIAQAQQIDSSRIGRAFSLGMMAALLLFGLLLLYLLLRLVLRRLWQSYWSSRR